MDKIILIVAGGIGSRFSYELPKQYFCLANGKTILENTVDKFCSIDIVDKIFIAVSGDDNEIKNLKFQSDKIIILRTGGNTRQDSVRNSLNEIINHVDKNSKILIHDACRPYVSKDLVIELINNLSGGIAVFPAIKPIDAIKNIDENYKAISKDSVIFAQTPQGFILDEILRCHNDYKDKISDDDISIYDGKIIHVYGDKNNIKITNREDVMLNDNIRIGSGFDVHKFDHSKTYMMLGGVKIDCGYGVEAHSDGDVVLHALADAMLGSIGEGDIGEHFPMTEEFKNADSTDFIKIIIEKFKLKNAYINNVDITVISEAPKISKYRDEIKKNIANILALEEDRVNIKATTTEKLGFLGRKEGIAAQANILIRILG